MSSRKMNFFQNLLSSRSTQRNNYHHYVCFGMFMQSAEIVTDHVNYDWSTEALYDAIEILTLIFLIIGYLREQSKWTWPYMAVEFTCLILGLLAYSICVAAMLFPSRFAGTWYEKELGHLTQPSKIRSRAFWTGIEAALYSVASAFELSILLACNRYFDDEKLRKKGLRDRPIILSQDGQEAGPRSAVIDMEPVMENSTPTNGKTRGGGGFPNPNFSLVDSDDENDNDEWHSTNKKANVLA